MPKSAKMTDHELVERLKFTKVHGTVKAASLLGIARSSLSQSNLDAKAKGLTADTIVETLNEEKLETKLKMAERTIKLITKQNESAEAIRREIYGLAELTPDPPSWIYAPRPPHMPGVPMTIWSDFHWGEVVSKNETGGANEFNRTIAKQRFKRLVDITLDLTFNHMVNPQYPGIVVCLGGDFISGNIHEELAQTNEGFVQQSILEVQEQLIGGIKLLADKFGKVFLPCVVGNHGRTTLKPRAKGRVFESYEWNLYCQLELYFREDKRVQFLIPNETDAYFNVLGHRFLLTHGDTLGVKGGDGIIGAIGPIARGVTKVGRSEAQIGRDFDTLLMGHYHTYIPRGDAVPVIVNGALKGFDEYARLMLRVPYSRPSQALWFVHQKYGITAQWQIYLDERRKSEMSSDWLKFQKRRV